MNLPVVYHCRRARTLLFCALGSESLESAKIRIAIPEDRERGEIVDLRGLERAIDSTACLRHLLGRHAEEIGIVFDGIFLRIEADTFLIHWIYKFQWANERN